MSSAAPSNPPAPPRRWGLRLLLGGVILVALLWAAPVIASHSPLVGWVCERASTAIGGKVSVGSVSIGWFSPLVVTNLEVRDADDRMVALAPRIEGDRTLLALVLDHDNLGSFQVKKPKFDVTFEGNQSNVEMMLAKVLPAPAAPIAGDAPPASMPPQIRVEVIDAMIDVHDADSKRDWPLGPISFSAIAFQDGADAVQANVNGTLSDGAEPGMIKADVALQNVIGANPKATIKGRFASFPLSLADVFARRYEPTTKLTGSLHGNGAVTVALQDAKPHLEFVGEVSGNDCTLATSALREPLVVERVRIPCNVRLDDRMFVAQNAEIDSDFGKIALKGSLDLAGSWRASFEQPNFDLSVDLSLAKIAERLPKTFHLHRDLRLTSGRLTAQCVSVRKENDVVWQVNVRAVDLRGVRGQKSVAWAEPMTLDLQARNLGKGMPLIDHLKCNARFLDIDGSSGPDQVTVTAKADLQELAEPLGQFIDLAEVHLTGRADGKIQARRLDTDNYLVHADAQVKQLHLTWLTGRAWQEALASATLDARVRIGTDRKQRVESVEAEIKLGSDRATLTLIEPIADLAAGWHGSANVRVDGDLSRWQTRARACTILFDDWLIAGQASVQAEVRTSPAALESPSLRVKADNLRCTGAGLSIVEPNLIVQTAARWNVKAGSIALTKTSVSCPTVEFKSDALSLDTATMAVRGKADFACDVARLRQWTLQPGAKAAEPISGSAVGRLDLQATDKSLGANLTASVINFAYGPAANPTWRESEIKCIGYGSYDRAADVVRVEKIDITGACFDANARGTIAHASTTRMIDIDGILAYDLAKMEPQLRPLFGKDVKIAGSDARPFKLSGPLYAKAGAELHFTELKGDASIAWKSLHALGCDVGPAQAKAVLQKGWLQLYPIETTLNGGKLRLQPNLRLEPEPKEMVLLSGTVIDHANITPQMCAGALGYAMPLLANVTQAEGTMSLSLDGGRIPLAAPATGEVKGTITLHTATVGANPTLRELAGALKVSTTTGLIKECKVPFQMTQGKVHHKDLELVFPEMTLKSSGAVGLDGSLAIVIDMPIPPRVAELARLTPAQAKQPVRIPIGGTLDHPRIDPQALNAITSVLGRSLLENELNKLLQPNR